MTALLFGFITIPLLDQIVKVLLRHKLRTRSLPLGVLGAVRLVHSQMWIMRPPVRASMAMAWAVWLGAAGTLAALCAMFPHIGWGAGLLMGGALSHALETSMRGSVSDYICLRFWPPFDLADTAVTLGAIGIVVEALPTLGS